MQTRTLDFDGHSLRLLSLDGSPAWIAREVGRTLGYDRDGKGLVDQIRQEWRDEFEEGVDYRIAKGGDFTPLSNIEGLDSPRGHLVLFESGLYLACILSKKPAGRRLRRWLADEVLPQLRREGRYEPSDAPNCGAEAAPLDLIAPRLALHQARELRLCAEGLKGVKAPRTEVAALYRAAARLLLPSLPDLEGNGIAQPEDETVTPVDDFCHSLVLSLGRDFADGRPRHAGEWAALIRERDLLSGHPIMQRGERALATAIGSALGRARIWGVEDATGRALTIIRTHPRGTTAKPLYRITETRPAQPAP